MISIQKILAPVDFSEHSEAAAVHAGALARHFNAGVLFLTVVEPAPFEHRGFTVGRSTEEENKQRLEEAGRRLRAFVETSGPSDGSETLAVSGDVAQRIEAAAAEHKADLVVMPTRGMGAFRRFLVGSVTAKVLHDLEIPVMTGAHLDDTPLFPDAPYRSVCCALGLREIAHSERVLGWAWEFARSWDAALHVVHVPAALELGAGDWFPPETKELVREAAAEKLQELIEKVGCEATVHVAGLDPEEYVSQVIQRTGGDLLVVGRSVPHGLLGGLHADAYGMIRSAPCPVLSV